MSSLIRPTLFSPRLTILTLLLLFPIISYYILTSETTAHHVDNYLPSSISTPIKEWVGSNSGYRNDGGTGMGVYKDVEGETKFVKGVAGVTMWENIYLFNGTYHIVTSDPESLPDPGWVMRGAPGDSRKHGPPGEDRWRIVSLDEAEEVLGRVAMRKRGISIFFNDSPGEKIGSFLDHYFHFAEVFLSGWRVIQSSYASNELPTRLMFRTDPEDWRDRAGLTTWLQQTVMPETVIEDAPIWQDRARSGVTYVFDKLAIVDRFSAHQEGGKNVGLWNKMTMDLVDLEVRSDWMNPLRESLIRFVTTHGCALNRREKDVPIVTYINRQRTGRRLADDDAKALDEELYKLASSGEIELYNQFFEDIPRPAQFCLALKSDIMIGVHGNGLTHQLWMKPGSAVLEFMSLSGFAMDYAFVAKLMGHEYHAIHNDTILYESEWIQPDGRPMYQGDTFHSNSIPVYGPFIAELVTKLARDR